MRRSDFECDVSSKEQQQKSVLQKCLMGSYPLLGVQRDLPKEMVFRLKLS